MWQFKNLYFGYEDNYLLEDVNIDIKENKIGIVGKNGIGKTTLLNIVGKKIAPQKGSVQVSGDSYFTIYDFSKYVKFTIRDFLKLVEPLESFDSSKSDYYIELLDIEEYLDLQIGNLSKGTQKKVGLLLTFLSKKEILLIDEPFESIDENTNNNIIEELRKIDKKYMIVSHDFRYLNMVCDKKYQIKDKGIKEYD